MKQHAIVLFGLMLTLTGKAQAQTNNSLFPSSNYEEIDSNVAAESLTQPIQAANSPYPSSGYEIPEVPEIRIDPEIDSRSIEIDNLKNKAIDYALSKLGVKTFLTDLNQTIARISGDIRTTLSDYGIIIPKGKAGLPNIQEAKIVFSEDVALNILNDIFGGQTGSTFNSRDEYAQDYLKQVSQEYSENSALSLRGQSISQTKIDTAISSARESVSIAEDSSGQDISQNILRNISGQFAISQQTDAMAIADMQDAKMDRSLSLQMQSETLAETSGNNARRLRETTAHNGASISTLGLITIPGMTEEVQE